LRATNDAAGRNNVLNMMKFHNATNNMVSWREEELIYLLLLSVPKVTVHASTGNRKQETRMHQTPFWLIRKTCAGIEENSRIFVKVLVSQKSRSLGWDFFGRLTFHCHTQKAAAVCLSVFFFISFPLSIH
jgi:hypothetical protein